MNRHAMALALCFCWSCASPSPVPEHVVEGTVCYVGEFGIATPASMLIEEQNPVLLNLAQLHPAVIAEVLLHPDLRLPSRHRALSSLRFEEGCLSPNPPREMSYEEFAAYLNWRLRQHGSVDLYLPDHLVSLEPFPMLQLMRVSVRFAGIDLRGNVRANFIVDLRHLTGAFEPGADLSREEVRAKMLIVDGGQG